MEFLTENVQRILVAGLLGAVIGLERELSGKSAGFRTVMLVCIGAALFTIVSHNMALTDPYKLSDVTRIASNIITGIGFIGAGIIFKGEQSVRGLTTAATVWVAAAIGMAIGNGDYWLGVAGTIAVWIILVIFDRLEKGFESLAEVRNYKITYSYSLVDKLMTYEDFFPDKGFRQIDSKIEKNGDTIINTWTVRAPKKKHDIVIRKMLADNRLTKVDY